MTRPRLSLVVPALAFAALPATAQDLVPARHPDVRAAMAALERDNAQTLAQQVAICEIPAPPFKEQARGLDLKRRFRELGLRNVRIDAEGNVIGERPGSAAKPLVVLSAHLDTVFPEGTDVTVQRDGTRLKGPGIGDDCRGLAVLVAVAKAMRDHGVKTRGTIVFVATVGEEGPGNLRGVRHLFAHELKGQVDAFLSVDGTGIGITSRAVGSHRYTVTYEGPGGHSYGAFGMPNPIHAAGRAIAKLADLQVPTTPKTTFNVGVIRGGTSVNSIPISGSFELDMRSESQEALDALDAQARAAIAAALDDEKARWPNSTRPLAAKIDTIGIRPADGRQADTARIVRTALSAAAAVGKPVQATGASSTDANVPMALGIPALTIGGGGRGTGAHGSEEAYDDGPDGFKGAQFVLLVVTGLAGIAGPAS